MTNDEAMTFAGWCYSQGIEGNYKEALYHHLRATRTEEQIDDPSVWPAAWSEVLHQVFDKLREKR